MLLLVIDLLGKSERESLLVWSKKNYYLCVTYSNLKVSEINSNKAHIYVYLHYIVAWECGKKRNPLDFFYFSRNNSHNK